MNSVTVKVEPAVLSDTAEHIRRLVSYLRQDFNAMQQTMEKTSFYWFGTAGDAQRDAFASQKARTEEILALLGQYPRDLLEMAQIYVSGEQKVAAQTMVLPSNLLD